MFLSSAFGSAITSAAGVESAVGIFVGPNTRQPSAMVVQLLWMRVTAGTAGGTNSTGNGEKFTILRFPLLLVELV
jgi:hypothetical protein